MVLVKTGHSKIWEPAQVASDIIKEYYQNGTVIVSLNGEGPCASEIGIFNLLDYVCESHGISKSKIVIETVNFEEKHYEYTIRKAPQHWIAKTVSSFKSINFECAKQVDQKLFGCLYNVPSWDRLCLLAYIQRTTKNQSILHCNGTWEPHKYNSYYLDSVTDYCSAEFFNIANYLKTNPTSALQDLTDKPVIANDMLKVITLYNNFFVDIVAETYSQGLTFFITEKTLRPMLARTPFIIHGPCGYLSTLKSDYGIKTFDRWWDESYDQLQNYDRIKKIYQIIDYLDRLTVSERVSMYNEMSEVLEHNRKQIMKMA
jgi:hypothetical protein